MLKAMKLKAINQIITKIQSHLYNVYKEENIAIGIIVNEVQAKLLELPVTDIKESEKLSAEEIIAKFY